MPGSLPMRLRDQVIGALNLFRAVPGALAPADMRMRNRRTDSTTSTGRPPAAPSATTRAYPP